MATLQVEGALWRTAEPRSLLPSFLEGLAGALAEHHTSATWPAGAAAGGHPSAEDVALPLSRLLFLLCSSGIVAPPPQPEQAPVFARMSAGSSRAAVAGTDALLAGSGSSCAGELIGALHGADEPDQDARREPGRAGQATGGDGQREADGLGEHGEPDQDGRGEPDRDGKFEHTPRVLEAAVSIERQRPPPSPEDCMLPLAAVRMDGVIEQGIRLWSPKKGNGANAHAGSTAHRHLKFDEQVDEAGGEAGSASTQQQRDHGGSEADTMSLEAGAAHVASLPEEAAPGVGRADTGPVTQGAPLGEGASDEPLPAPLADNGVWERSMHGHAAASLTGDDKAHAAVESCAGDVGSTEALGDGGGPGSGQQKRGWRARMARAVSRVSIALTPKAVAPPGDAQRSPHEPAAERAAALAAAGADALAEPAAAEHVDSRAGSGSGDPPSASQSAGMGAGCSEVQSSQHPEPAESCDRAAEQPLTDAAVSHEAKQSSKRSGLLKGKLAKLAWKPGLRNGGAPDHTKSSLAASDVGAWPELEEVPILHVPHSMMLVHPSTCPDWHAWQHFWRKIHVCLAHCPTLLFACEN